MAAYEKLKSGKHSYTVRLPNGRRRRFTDPLKRVAKAQAEEFEAALRRGDQVHLHDRKLTVAKWHADWTGTRRIEAATAKKNDSHWRNHVEPRWGGEPLMGIRRSQVQRWVVDMEKAGVGADTIHAAYNLLAGMLTGAVLEGRLAASPCVEIDLPTVVPPDMRELTRDEYGRIQLALASRTLGVRGGGRVPDPAAATWQGYVALGCFSGLRPGELAGLDVPQVDFARQLVYVRQVLTRDGLRDYPKNDASIRWVPFPDEVGRLLWPLCADRGAGPVFATMRGRRVRDENFRDRVWRPALEQAGIGYVRPYVMRHTAASWLAQAGVSDDEIADMLGHASTRMTRGVYRHMRPDAHPRIRAAWARADAPSVPHGGNGKSPRPVGRVL